MKTTSWKTTLGGILSFLGLAASYYPNPVAQKFGPALIGLGATLTGVAARDNNVPSSAVPVAAERDAQIKGDTTLVNK